MTVRDATFEFLRRRGLTDIFSNPGSTEIPFLTGLPDDLNFVLGLHEGSVVEHGERLRAGATAAVVRAAAHDSRLRQRGQRHRDVARQPHAHRDRDRPAGSPAHRVRAVSLRTPRRACGRLSRLGLRAVPRAGCARRARARLPRGGDPSRAGDRDRADGRLARGGRRAARGRRTAARAPSRVRSATSRSPLWPTCSPARRARRSSPAPGSTRPSAGPRSWRWPSGSARRSTRSRSATGPRGTR